MFATVSCVFSIRTGTLPSVPVRIGTFESVLDGFDQATKLAEKTRPKNCLRKSFWDDRLGALCLPSSVPRRPGMVQFRVASH